MQASPYTNLYTAADVVEIDVRVGTDEERRKLADAHPGLMVIPDGAIIRELLTFIIAQRITPWRSIVAGGGRYTALFRREDGRRVVAWLEENAAKRSDTVL